MLVIKLLLRQKLIDRGLNRVSFLMRETFFHSFNVTRRKRFVLG